MRERERERERVCVLEQCLNPSTDSRCCAAQPGGYVLLLHLFIFSEALLSPILFLSPSPFFSFSLSYSFKELTSLFPSLVSLSILLFSHFAFRLCSLGCIGRPQTQFAFEIDERLSIAHNHTRCLDVGNHNQFCILNAHTNTHKLSL